MSVMGGKRTFSVWPPAVVSAAIADFEDVASFARNQTTWRRHRSSKTKLRRVTGEEGSGRVKGRRTSPGGLDEALDRLAL